MSLLWTSLPAQQGGTSSGGRPTRYEAFKAGIASNRIREWSASREVTAAAYDPSSTGPGC